MGHPAFATREQIMGATDIKSTAIQASAIDRLIFSASRQIEQVMRRHFYPRVETVTYEPPYDFARYGFWLNRDIQSVTNLEVDDVGLTVDDFTLHPSSDGPPYSRIELSGFENVETAITGVWGYSDDEAPAGALDGNVATTTETTIQVTNGAAIGVGDLIHIEDERLIVTNKVVVDSAVNTTAEVAAEKSVVTLPVGDGTAFTAGETVLVDAERMLITDVAGNNLIVKRAHDGSTLALHVTDSDIYVYRLLTVERGAEGTTAAIHADTTAITRNVPPGTITELCIAEVTTALEQESAAYARTIGSGEAEREAAGKGLADVRHRAKQYQRLRKGVV
jgi:hypothetical protein